MFSRGFPLVILACNHDLDLGRVWVVVVIEEQINIAGHFYQHSAVEW